MSLRFLYHLFIKCARFGRSKGFGIQSPTHYSFVRYIINERYPYYAYNDLKDMFPEVSKIDRAHLELLFRLSNWRQPSIVTLLGCDTHIYREYIHRGCNKSLIHDSFQDRAISDYVIISANVLDVCLDILLLYISDNSILVVEGINTIHATLWNDITKCKRATVCFDLYFLGIVSFSNSPYNKQYKLSLQL